MSFPISFSSETDYNYYYYPAGNPSVTGVPASDPVNKPGAVDTENSSNPQSKTGKAEKKGECQTCKNRKYVDGSDEGNVSFKAPGHIAPEESASVVMAHEKQHVANAERTGNEPGNKLVSASVSLKTAICPECGRAYIAGGVTRTRIQYGDSKYEQNKKKADLDAVLGANVDEKA